LSSADKPGPKNPPRRSWACAAADRRTQIATTDNQIADWDPIHLLNITGLTSISPPRI
jgi:hypothetical protein